MGGSLASGGYQGHEDLCWDRASEEKEGPGRTGASGLAFLGLGKDEMREKGGRMHGRRPRSPSDEGSVVRHVDSAARRPVFEMSSPLFSRMTLGKSLYYLAPLFRHPKVRILIARTT